MSQLTVEVVAADRVVWEGPASSVSARTLDGELGVLPGHEPMLSVLADSDVRVQPVDGAERTVHVDGGFLSVDHDVVRIVSETISDSNA
ncbi:F0F1 ATP synthase subunit epsilon [Demetria terragena]|uniref:F0F1 ATP synthase subunit epsilon n=1 Tax=Demetria terragena TaxID=63959 RepID=UPI000369BC87|nr:F0F1 ATP synthase subunit epsilon [Demetria terragena]